MASQVYYSWDAAGRPVVPSQPIREYVTRLKATFQRVDPQKLPLFNRGFRWVQEQPFNR